jgi:hypothetical protein
MRYHAVSRRHFLQGVGATLALPFLPSLAPRTASAAVFDGPKYFVALGTRHGNVPIEDWAPVERALTEVQLYNGNASEGYDHQRRFGVLADLLDSTIHDYNPSGSPELSRVLGSFLNPYLDKLNLLAGLDIMFDIGHHRGGNLGNYHDNDNSDARADLVLPSMPTIDRVIARSPEFYPSGDPFTVRAINFSNGLHLSSDGSVGSVSAQPLTGGNRPSARQVFDAVFGDGVPFGGSGADPRLSVVDRVIDDYRRVMNSPFGDGSRISQSDRDRLDEFVTDLNDVEQKLQNLGSTCESSIAPEASVHLGSDDNDYNVIDNKWDTYLNVVVAAFRCGRSRVATIGINELEGDFNGDWHTDIGHGAAQELWYDYTIRAHRFAAEKIYTPLLEKLDVSIDGVNDTTYLDNSVVMWNHESGQVTHKSTSVPTLVAGSAGGFFNTGMFQDYRNLSNQGLFSPDRSDLAYPQHPGVPYNRWLYTILRSMGIPDAQYKTGALVGMQGYGDPHVNNRERNGNVHIPYSNAVIDDMGTMLNEIVA